MPSMGPAAWLAAAPKARATGARPRHGSGTAKGLIAALVGAGCFFALYPALAGRLAEAGMIEQLDHLASQLDLGLDQIEISGHRFTSDGEIFDAVDLPNVGSFLRFDGAAVRARIERLAWVDTVAIERRLPNRIGIRVTERRPVAAWDRGNRDVLIDVTGRQLATVARGTTTDLPRVAGEAAPDDAGRLLVLVADHPDIAARLDRAERVSGRRWRLILRNGARIELPADADAAALAMLVEPRPGGRLIDVAASVIDLTILRRITVRKLSAEQRG
jgi:cell division protein FtsQ